MSGGNSINPVGGGGGNYSNYANYTMAYNPIASMGMFGMPGMMGMGGPFGQHINQWGAVKSTELTLPEHMRAELFTHEEKYTGEKNGQIAGGALGASISGALLYKISKAAGEGKGLFNKLANVVKSSGKFAPIALGIGIISTVAGIIAGGEAGKADSYFKNMEKDKNDNGKHDGSYLAGAHGGKFAF